MFLFFGVDILLGDILGLPFKTLMYEETAKITGLTSRQVSESFRKKSFSFRAEKKINLWLHEQGVNYLHDLIVGSDVAVGWKNFVKAQQKNSSFFLPKTLTLISELAEKDLSLLRELEGMPSAKRFYRCKTHIVKDVLPFYFEDPREIIEKIEKAENVEQLIKYLPWLMFVSTLYLLAYAEAEYLLTYSNNQTSVLVKCLPISAEIDTSPSQIFFSQWLKTINLDKNSFVEEMIGHYGEIDPTGDLIDDEPNGINKEALEKQVQRYLGKGKTPKWATLEHWAKGLYWKAAEIQGREEGHDAYASLVMDVYGGVLILDKLYEEGGKLFQRDKLLLIMATYREFFVRHLVVLKEGAGNLPAPKQSSSISP